MWTRLTATDRSAVRISVPPHRPNLVRGRAVSLGSWPAHSGGTAPRIAVAASVCRRSVLGAERQASREISTFRCSETFAIAYDRVASVEGVPMSDFSLLKNALAVGSAKEAAVYFDKVVPFDLSAGYTKREEENAIAMEEKYSEIIESLLPGVEDPDSFYRGYTAISNGFWSIVALRKWYFEHGAIDSFFDLDREYLNAVDEDIGRAFDISLSTAAKSIHEHREYSKYRREYNRFLNNGLRSIGFDTFSEWHDEYYSEYYGGMETDDKAEVSRVESVVAVLRDIDLVDADKLSWRKIVEIRKDKKSIQALRDLRLFLHKEVADIGPVALRETIESHYDKYQDAVKWWRLDTVKKPLAMMVSKEGIGLTSLGAIATFLVTGAPVDPMALISAAKTALASGVALNVAGSGALTLHETLMDRDKLKQAPGSEVRYLAYLRKKAR